ncbi:MAG: tetratricopeptide repeat protein [Oscillospiraceae bacterium]|nr:tetratricopeptide repeat protein [Oscillospiraceae bacterium]
MNIKKLAALSAAVIMTLTLTACNADGAARKYKKLYSEENYSEALDGFLQIDAEKLKNFAEEEYYYLIGNCYMHMEDYEKALAYQEKCTELAPEYFKAWVNMGVAYKRLGNSEKAYECYDTALQYDTQDYAPFYISLGASYIERGKPVSAVEYLEKAQRLDPENADIYAFLAIAYAMEIEPEKSDEAYKTAEAMGYPQMDKIREQLNKIR